MASSKGKSSKPVPVDASTRLISFKEARAIARLPTEADVAALQVKNSRSGFTLGETYRVVENCEAESSFHSELSACGGKPSELSRRPERSDVMLVIDTTNGLLFSCYPRWADGKRQPGMYNRLSQELAKRAYSGTTGGYARARENGNVETVDGVERFCFPSALLNSARAKASSSSSGTGAAALASSSTNANEVLMSNARGMTADEHSNAAVAIFTSMCEDVEQTRQMIVDGLDADDGEDVCGIAVGHVSGDRRAYTVMPPDPNAKDYEGHPTDIAQFIDETNCAIAGAQPAFGTAASRRRRPVANGKSAASVTHNSALPDSTSSVPSSPASMSSKAKSSKPAAAAAAAASSVAAPATLVNKKRVGDVAPDELAVDEARKLLRLRVPALYTGLFNPDLRKACLGRYADGDTAPAFILAGKRMAPQLKDVSTVDRMCEYIGTITDKGAEGMKPPERAYVSKATFESALFAEVDGKKIPDDKKAAIIKACPLVGLQFASGLFAGGLAADIDNQLDALVTDVIVPMIEKAEQAEAAAKEARDELERLKAQVAAAEEEAERKAEQAALEAKQAEEEAERKAKEIEDQMIVADVTEW